VWATRSARRSGSRRKDLARRRPDLTQGRAAAHDDEDADGAVSINELAAQLLPRRPAGDDRPEEAALAHYLGLDDAVKAGVWPSLGDSAQAGEVDRTTLTAALIKARERWLKNPAFTELRQQIDSLLRSQGQVMSARKAPWPCWPCAAVQRKTTSSACARPPRCCGLL
jgi:hypothetical protein